MSASRSGCAVCQSSRDRVLSLDAGQSIAANRANYPKCGAASVADRDTTGSPQMPSDQFGDLPERNALVGDGMEWSSGVALDGQAEDACGVPPVHRRPAVVAVADVGSDAVLAGEADDPRYETVIAAPMDRRERRTTVARTPRDLSAATAASGSRGTGSDAGRGSLASVAIAPGARSAMPEVTTRWPGVLRRRRRGPPRFRSRTWRASGAAEHRRTASSILLLATTYQGRRLVV